MINTQNYSDSQTFYFNKASLSLSLSPLSQPLPPPPLLWMLVYPPVTNSTLEAVKLITFKHQVFIMLVQAL